VYLHTITSQRLCKGITAASNTQATTEELLDLSFSMWSVLYKKAVGVSFFPEVVVCYWKGGSCPNAEVLTIPENSSSPHLSTLSTHIPISSGKYSHHIDQYNTCNVSH
jgi:hypothetical protein